MRPDRSRLIRILRLAGVVAIFCVLVIHHAPERHALIPEQALDALRPLSSAACARIAGPDVEPDRVTYVFRCGEGGELKLQLLHRESPGGLTQEGDCLAGERAGAWLRCTVTGSASEETKQRFRQSTREVVAQAFGSDPFTTPLVTSLTIEQAALVLCTQLLISFLWLVATGAFGYGSLRRSDAVALLPFLVALILREGLTLHSIQEVEIQFASGLTVRHSVIYPLWQLFYRSLVADSQAFTCHLNGVLGAVAVLPVFLFLRQRTGSWQSGFLAALFFAVHPVLARFAPTDGPNSLLLLTWFSGLALLSGPVLTAEVGIAGAALLGIAATCRMEGSLFLLASLFMLDLPALWRAVKKFPVAAVAAVLLVAGLIALQMHYLLESHVSKAARLSVFIPPLPALLHDVLRQPESEDPVFALLLVAGGVAGLVSRSWRVGLGAVAGALLVIAPVTGTGAWIVGRHEMVPGCALRVLAAGVGAAWLFSPLAARRRFGWLAVLPGTLAAAHLFWINHAFLHERFLFNHEYEMVRRVLGPGGAAEPDCVLLAVSSEGDLDVHHFEQAVPETRVIDCRNADCAHALTWSRCTYYLRSIGCYRGIRESPLCGKGTGDAALPPECLFPACAAVESSATLWPVDVRSLDVYPTFPDTSSTYPARATLGLFRATTRNPRFQPLEGDHQ